MFLKGTSKWRLWNPEQENQLSQEDELWNDIVFSSAAEYIENETSNPALVDMDKEIPSESNFSTNFDSAEFACKPCGRVLGR